MSITAAAALLLLLAALFLALMLAAEKERNAASHAAARRAGTDGQAADARRTRHLSPHRAAIERLKGKEAARGRR